MSEQEKEIENADEIINLVENILEFNKQQKVLGLKILTPNQMLSKLPTSLAQLKAGNNQAKLGKYCILCTDQKNSRKFFTKVWLTLIKHGNNLYEH